MSNIQNDNSFLKLLDEETIKKIKIDSELIPAFKIVISKMNDYFSRNGLMDVRDWNNFFERFLITNNSEQVCIKVGHISDDTVGGEYSKDKKIIAVSKPDDKDTLCHEFIHFLVMHNSNSLNAKVSDSSFFNEGMTEYMTSYIMGRRTLGGYFGEYDMVEFYCKITKNPFKHFLNNQFAFEDKNYAPMNLIRSSERYQNNNKNDSYLDIQREIIINGLNDYSIKSFDDFINIVTIINQRPCFDGDYIDYIFEKISDKYIENLKLNEQQNIDIKNKLMKYCKLSNKYQLYGDNDVAEYLIDGLHIAFDKKGKSYNDFPLSGTNKRGQIGFNGVNKITVIHKDKYYVINTEKMNCKNWKEPYDKAYADLKNSIYLLNHQTMENSKSKSSLKK